MSWAHNASGRDNLVLSKVDVEQASVIDKLAGNLCNNWKEGDWDLPRADRMVANGGCNEKFFHYVAFWSSIDELR